MVAAVGLSPPTGVLETETLMLCHDYSAKYRKALLPSATYPLVAGMYVCMYVCHNHPPASGGTEHGSAIFPFPFPFPFNFANDNPKEERKKKDEMRWVTNRSGAFILPVSATLPALF